MKNQKLSVKQILLALLSVALLVVLDQITKIWALHSLKNQPAIVWIKGVFELQYLENRGAAFGVLQNQLWIFILSVVVMLAVVVYFYYYMPNTKRFQALRIICVFISAGAIGNVIDRIGRGFVVDFFYFSLIDFPIFNVADIYVTVSMICLLLLIFFYYKEEDFAFLSNMRNKNTGDQNGTH